jgi:hypothetical protein
MPRLLERINFSKVVTILAVTFVVAIGACGLTAFASNSFGSFAVVLGVIELGVMILSAIGLAVMLILWLIAAIMGVNRTAGSDTMGLSDPKDENDKRDEQG